MTPKFMTTDDRDSTVTVLASTASRQTAMFLGDSDRHIVFLRGEHSPAAEEYRRIISRLVSQHPDGGTLMVTSPTPGDGKTLTSLNLALGLAERTSTLLVDLDTRHSTVRSKLNIASTSLGVEEALLEEAAPDHCLVSIPGTHLTACLNRGDGRRITDLMGHDRPERFLGWALQRFSWVIIDTPPAFPIADTLEIANHVRIGIMVVRARKTPVRLAKKALDAFKGHIHYVMFNDNGAPSYSIYNHPYYFNIDGNARRR
jgi:Mrp family chromosome partitioning ATPase